MAPSAKALKEGRSGAATPSSNWGGLFGPSGAPRLKSSGRDSASLGRPKWARPGADALIASPASAEDLEAALARNAAEEAFAAAESAARVRQNRRSIEEQTAARLPSSAQQSLAVSQGGLFGA